MIFRTQNENNPLFLLGEIPQLILIALYYFMICDGNKALFGILGCTNRNEIEKHVRHYEDCNLWYKLYTAGYQGFNLDEPLYMMRDDRNAYSRRTVESRMRAVYVQWTGFRMIHMPLKYYPVLVFEFLKSIAIVAMPQSIYMKLHRK